MPNPPKLKALTFKILGGPHFTEHKFPTSIGKHALLVKVNAAALNPIDIKMTKLPVMGLLPFEKGIGKDFAGKIIQVGDDVKNTWKVGDEVCGMLFRAIGLGSIASYVVVDTKYDAVMKMPKGLSFEKAAAFPLCFGTAFDALHKVDSNLYKQDHANVLVLGGSTSVGMFAIQLAKKYFGASKVVATCSKSSEQIVQNLGADITVDYKTSKNLATDIAGVIDSQLGGHKFLIVVDCVGGYEIVSRFPEVLLPSKEGSAFVSTTGDARSKSVYTLSGSLAESIYRFPFMATRIAFGKYYGINYHLGLVSTSGPWVSKAVEAFEKNDIQVLIDSSYDWNNWKEGWTKLENQKCHGKVVLKITV